jgi:hypothetical protein
MYVCWGGVFSFGKGLKAPYRGYRERCSVSVWRFRRNQVMGLNLSETTAYELKVKSQA